MRRSDRQEPPFDAMAVQLRGFVRLCAVVSVALAVQACDPVPIPTKGEAAEPSNDSESSKIADPGERRRREPDERRQAEPDELGEGFLVWESNRSGSWRIWTRPLTEGPPRQLTPNEPGRQHYAPHISPDGAWVAYLSAREAGRDYTEGGSTGMLRLVRPDGSESRDLIEGARTYFENRAVVWRSPTELIYIGEDFRTRLLDIESGETRLLTKKPAAGLGYLIDAQLGHASSNSATFSIYEPEQRTVLPRADQGGCQPYFSHDGRWGVWTAGAGGPIQKMELDSRRIDGVLDKNDTRLPDGWGYLYFPMLSRDGSLLAVAASRNEHDHFKSDYEVFVVETDPETLELIGQPRRYTHDPATDRYPDVYRAPLALGRHRGEAPFELEVSSPDGAPWLWSSGDEAGGATASESERLRHRYERPGVYEIEARRGQETLRGQVVVAAGLPPEVVGSRLSGDGRQVVIEFDEPVRLDDAKVSLASGREVTARRAGPSGRELVVEFGEPIRGVDRVILAGVEDLGLQPRQMAETRVKVGPLRWPASLDGLVFVWQTADRPNLLPDAADGAGRAVVLGRSGVARLDHFWAMLPGGGMFIATPDDAARVRHALQSSNEMTLELTLRAPVGGRAFVVSAGNNKRLNFQLERRRGKLIFSARTHGRGPNSTVELFQLPASGPSHVVVTYSPARLRAYLNGEMRLDAGAEIINGDFFAWRDVPLTFGEGEAGDTAIEGVAIYDRALSADEVEAQYERYRLQMEARPPVASVTVEARLVGKAPVPKLAEISPYREALVVDEYQVLRVESGELDVDRIRVAHWAILDGERLALNARAAGEVHRLRLEPFAANPQLASLFLGQAESIDSSLPLYYSPDLQHGDPQAADSPGSDPPGG